MKSKIIITTIVIFIAIISIISATILNSDTIQREFNKSKVYNESKR